MWVQLRKTPSWEKISNRICSNVTIRQKVQMLSPLAPFQKVLYGIYFYNEIVFVFIFWYLTGHRYIRDQILPMSILIFSYTKNLLGAVYRSISFDPRPQFSFPAELMTTADWKFNVLERRNDQNYTKTSSVFVDRNLRTGEGIAAVTNNYHPQWFESHVLQVSVFCHTSLLVEKLLSFCQETSFLLNWL